MLSGIGDCSFSIFGNKCITTNSTRFIVCGLAEYEQIRVRIFEVVQMFLMNAQEKKSVNRYVCIPPWSKVLLHSATLQHNK